VVISLVGLQTQVSSVTIRNSKFNDNVSNGGNEAGASYVDIASALSVMNCSYSGNTASGGDSHCELLFAVRTAKQQRFESVAEQ
jgi:hypothetical protein